MTVPQYCLLIVAKKMEKERSIYTEMRQINARSLF